MSRSVHISTKLKDEIQEQINYELALTGVKLKEGQLLERAWAYYRESITLQAELNEYTSAAIRRIEVLVERMYQDDKTEGSRNG